MSKLMSYLVGVVVLAAGVFVLVQKADIPYGFFLGPFLIIVGVALTARGGLRKSGEASAK